MRLDGFELRPRPTASVAAAVQLAFARAGLTDALRPDAYASAWRTAALRESAGYDGEPDVNAELRLDARGPRADP